jgi:hypothetical protein
VIANANRPKPTTFKARVVKERSASIRRLQAAAQDRAAI